MGLNRARLKWKGNNDVQREKRREREKREDRNGVGDRQWVVYIQDVPESRKPSRCRFEMNCLLLFVKILIRVFATCDLNFKFQSQLVITVMNPVSVRKVGDVTPNDNKKTLPAPP